ncbi:hypothetical protein EON62_02530 [archaeon]|nr:MAG: hypothetical protein EON62_02530 [archaeon]
MWHHTRVMINFCKLLDANTGELHRHLNPPDISELRRESGVVIWMDIIDADDHDLALLREEFGFHTLAIEDCRHAHQRPKLDQYDGYMFMVLYEADKDEVTDCLLTTELNMFMGVDKLYGVYPWYWYLSEGITAMCGTQIPFVLIGVFMCRRRSAVEIVGIMAWSLFVLSCAAHKEHRFLLPVSSLFNIVAARGWFVLWRAHTLRRSRAPQDEDAALLKKARVLDGEHSEHAGPQGHAQQVSSAAENAAAARLEPYWAPSLNLFRVGVAGVIIANLVAATYINCFHQRGSIHVLEHLSAASLSALTLRAGSDAGDGLPSHGGDSGAVHAGSSTAQFMDVHFLMSCHSTPFYSMLHAPAHMLQLDCSPASRLGLRMRHLPACTPASGEAGSRNASAAYDAALAARWQLGISESQLWIDAPERVLRAMYGRHPRAPALCAHARSAAGAAAMNATVVSGELDAVAGARVRTLPPVPTFGDVPPPLGCSEEDTFATPTFSFVAEFAPSLTSEPVDAHLLSWRDLPTHLVLNERSASSDVVRHFLEEFHYAPSSLFSQGHLPGDRHAAVAGPDSIVVFEHRCWTDASGSAPIVDA